jgi:hypothetical protein
VVILIDCRCNGNHELAWPVIIGRSQVKNKPSNSRALAHQARHGNIQARLLDQRMLILCDFFIVWSDEIHGLAFRQCGLGALRLNAWPFWGAGIKIETLSPDFRFCRVTLKSRWWNKNANRPSLVAACSP